MGRCLEDVIGTRDEKNDQGLPLLEKVMQSGRITRPLPSLAEIRQGFRSNFEILPERYKKLSQPAVYPVRLSPALEALQK
jgi:nicotinate phosphoribosyltransferase